MALGAGALTSSLASCSTLPLVRRDFSNNVLEIGYNEFSPEANALLVRTKLLEHDILVIRKAEMEFKAIYMKCTHNHFPLTYSKTRLVCTSHGAEFNLEGEVTRGPAKDKLTSFRVETQNDALLIHIA